jgi:Flp pilus assembly protein TadD
MSPHDPVVALRSAEESIAASGETSVLLAARGRALTALRRDVAAADSLRAALAALAREAMPEARRARYALAIRALLVEPLYRLGEHDAILELARAGAGTPAAGDSAARDLRRLRTYAAMSLERLGREDDALAAYMSLLRDAPDDEFATGRLLKLRVAAKPLAAALAELEAMLRVSTRAANPQLWLLLGDLRARAGDDALAAEAYAEALRLAPRNRFALEKLGYAAARRGDHAVAARCLREPFLANPASHPLRRALVRAHQGAGDVRGLRAVLEEALRLHPDVGVLYHELKKLPLGGGEAP